jgi:hypothetical protein
MREVPQIGVPEAGFYKCRLAKHAIAVAVRIWYGRPVVDGEELDRSLRWCAEVDGETTRVGSDAAGEPTVELLDVFHIWTHCCGSPIDETEYRFLLHRKGWAVEHDPEHPAANPRKPINVRKLLPGW